MATLAANGMTHLTPNKANLLAARREAPTQRVRLSDVLYVISDVATAYPVRHVLEAVVPCLGGALADLATGRQAAVGAVLAVAAGVSVWSAFLGLPLFSPQA